MHEKGQAVILEHRWEGYMTLLEINTIKERVDKVKDDLLKSLIVREVNITECGDLVIAFDKGITLTVYLEVTNDTECWRFFEKDGDEKYDLVVLGNLNVWNR